MLCKIDVRKFLPRKGILGVSEIKNVLTVKWFYSSCTLPKEIEFDEEIAWYLGLRHGDKAEKNKGIIGIGNTNLKIIKRVFRIFVKRFYIPIEKIRVELRYNNSENLKIVKSFVKKLGIRDENIKEIYHQHSNHTVISLFAYNIVLRRLLDWLQENIKEILSKPPTTVAYAYHAGYFDAEGHVDKTSNCFSWRTTKLSDAYLEQKLLQNLNFNVRIHTTWEKHLHEYSFVIKIGNTKTSRENDFTLFKNIIPFLVHSEKHKEGKELLNGNRLRKIDIKKYLPIILDNLKEKQFKVTDFCKCANISKPCAQRILKAFKDQGLINVISGKRIIVNGRLSGQEPDIYMLNLESISNFQ